MHQSPRKDFRNNRRNPTILDSVLSKPTQHGCFLLDVPGEILSAITANLDPPALLALGESHITLSRHVEEDTTWRIAFETNFGTGPPFRRIEPTWRKEYTNRHKSLLRFAYSRVPSTTHSPLPAPAISHIHLLSTSSEPTGWLLLSLSLKYGIIARSIPYTGRVLPGFLDATGSTTGNGVGNPNAEFTPNISACAIASTGGTVRILWGYQTGHISFMVTNRMLEKPRRPAQEFRVSQEDEMHHGPVLDLTWIDDSDSFAVSGGSDGQVKVWDYTHHSTRDLVWVPSRSFTTPSHPSEAPVPCVKVSGNRTLGTVVAVRKNGSIDIWRGFDFGDMNAEKVRFSTTALPGPARTDVKVLALHIDPPSGDVLVSLRGEVCFYRVQPKHDTFVTAYGAPEGGAILSSLQPYFLSNEGQESFILTGDKLGGVNTYVWGSDPTVDSIIRPARTFQASTPVENNRESITALQWTPAIIATGTSGGVVVVWDSLTFERLRVIVRPVGLRRTGRRYRPNYHQQTVGLDEDDPEAPSPAVKQILVGDGEDKLIMNAGGEVIAWRAGDVSTKSIGKSPLKGGKTTTSAGRGPTSSPRGMAKSWSNGRAGLAEPSGRWSGQAEIKMMIADSQAQIRHEREEARRLGKKDIKTEHQKQLEKMGLTEGEALDYALMLSRESHPSPVPVVVPSTGTSFGSVDASTSPTAESGPGDALTEDQVQAMIEGGFFSSNEPVRDANTAAPPRPFEPEADIPSVPMVDASAGEQLHAALGDGVMASSAGPIRVHSLSTPTPSPPVDLELEFPAITPPQFEGVVETPLSQSPTSRRNATTFEDESPSPSSTHSSSLLPAARARRRESISSAVSSWSSMSGGSEAARQNAWSRPMNVPNLTALGSGSTSSSGSTRSGDVSGGSIVGGGLDGMDEDLRYALELSLAEARSRGEV